MNGERKLQVSNIGSKNLIETEKKKTSNCRDGNRKYKHSFVNLDLGLKSNGCSRYRCYCLDPPLTKFPVHPDSSPPHLLSGACPAHSHRTHPPKFGGSWRWLFKKFSWDVGVELDIDARVRLLNIQVS